ncbi:JAB domain-containing protein [Terrimonas sp. NA20]|uniref:JAB domain-containing protein n=1 Tax=Terrimonas ginsenosidimutans TaxID=2908004 RepID=A0ABS9KKF5_9BACT|nr:JAB domain-containing protein [Terrimonas ginsenosidimutans]MCG2612801.1 JAB domain-containing protein [Terrimonas ginsenosidimutans]
MKITEPIKTIEAGNQYIRSAADIFSLLQPVLLSTPFPHRNREHVWTISLDSANKILHIELVTMGSVNRAMVEPMEVFSTPLQKRAVKLIVVHNHPGGLLRPSPSDRFMASDLNRLGRELKIPVIDHVIISEEGYYSFAEQDQLTELPRKDIMHATMEMSTTSFRRIKRRGKLRRRFV